MQIHLSYLITRICFDKLFTNIEASHDSQELEGKKKERKK